MAWEGVKWIHLAWYRNKWRAFVNTAVGIRVPEKAGNFFSCWGTPSFWRRTLNLIPTPIQHSVDSPTPDFSRFRFVPADFSVFKVFSMLGMEFGWIAYLRAHTCLSGVTVLPFSRFFFVNAFVLLCDLGMYLNLSIMYMSFILYIRNHAI